MNQFSTQLHTGKSNFKKRFLRPALFLFFLFSFLITYSQTNPAVTINQSAAQPDPTNLTPINFTVLFDQPVTGFTSGDVTISGTAGGIIAVIAGGPTLYNVAVSGMIYCGTVTVNIPAGVCTNALLQPNLASTSTDNTVTYLPALPNPNVTINQAASQTDPTSASPINFTVQFDQPVTGFATGDVTLSGTAGATTGIVTGSGTTYNVAVSGMTAIGTVIATIAAGVSQNACTQPNNASTSTDNTVTITCVPPIVNVTPLFSCGGVAGLYGVPLSASSGPPVSGSVTVSSGTINLIVPDNTANGVSNIIAMAGVPLNATITNVAVTLNMSHTYPADMVFNLKGPSGQILSLYKHNTNTDNGAASIPTAGFYNAVVSGTATTAFVVVPTPFRYGQTAPAGPYRPDALNGVSNSGYTIMDPAGFVSNAPNLASLYSTAFSTTGNWTLAMCDGGRTGDIGILSSWALTIDYTTPFTVPTYTYIWSPLAGLYTDPTVTAPYSGTSLPLVYAAPTTATIYTVTATNTATGCTNTATASVNYTPPSPNIIPPSVNMCLGDPAVKLRVASGNGVGQFCSGTVNIAVPDNNPAGAFSSINVNGVGVNCSITGINVTINMPHTKIGNMVFALKAPNNTVLNLDYHLSATGGTGATTGFVNTNISSLGGPFLSSGTNPYTGTFRADAQALPAGGFGANGPTGMLQTVSNWASLTPTTAAANGNWTLGFYDGVTGDVGTLTSWCLEINYSCPAVPASPAVWSPIAGLFSDANGSIPYVGNAVDSVWVRIIPAGVYPYQVTTSGVPPGSPLCTSPPRTVVVTVAQPVTITTQPVNQTVCVNSSAAFTVGFTGTGPATFQWQVSTNGGITFNNVNNGAPYSGGSTGTLTLNPVTAALNGYLYRVVINGGSGSCGAISSAALLTVGQAVTINTQPVNQTLCEGGAAFFTVGVTGSGPFAYQWQVSTNGGSTYNNINSGGPYTGVNTPILTVNPATLAMNGYLFRVVINGGSGCTGATSSAALLTVGALPTIVITANPLVIGPTQTTTIHSSVTPNPAATYTWYYNSAVIPGATADTLLITYGSPGDYQLKVTDVNGCTNLSNIITIANSFSFNLFTYPNPSSGRFQVRYNSPVNNPVQRSLIIYNNWGERIITRNFTQTIPYQKVDVDVRANGKGLYWVELRDGYGRRLALSRVVVQ